MLILNNCSTFLGFGACTVHMLHSNRTFSLWKTNHRCLRLSLRVSSEVGTGEATWQRQEHTPSFRRPPGPSPRAVVSHSPLHRLPVGEERPEARDALESQGAKAPVVDSHCVLLLLQQFRGLKRRMV